MATEWFYQTEAGEVGPLGSQQMRQLAASGRLRRDDMVRKGTSTRWVQAGSLAGLFPEAEPEPSARRKKKMSAKEKIETANAGLKLLQTIWSFFQTPTTIAVTVALVATVTTATVVVINRESDPPPSAEPTPDTATAPDPQPPEEPTAGPVSLLGGLNFRTAPQARFSGDQSWTEDRDADVLRATGEGAGEAWTSETYQDFELTFEYRFPNTERLSPNGGGVVIRANGWNDFERDPRGVEIELSSRERGRNGQLIAYDTSLKAPDDRRLDRRTVDVVTSPNVKADGEWNEVRIMTNGPRLFVYINGTLVNSAEYETVRAGSIVFRSQLSAVEYRQIRLMSYDE